MFERFTDRARMIMATIVWMMYIVVFPVRARTY